MVRLMRQQTPSLLLHITNASNNDLSYFRIQWPHLAQVRARHGAENSGRQGGRQAHPMRQADALVLPFEDAAFDLVCCQFGAMFFPNRGAAYAQARRVLRPNGRFVFSVWDRIEESAFADEVTHAVATVFPHDPRRFLARTPHGYHDTGLIREGLGSAQERHRPVFQGGHSFQWKKGLPLRHSRKFCHLTFFQISSATAV